MWSIDSLSILHYILSPNAAFFFENDLVSKLFVNWFSNEKIVLHDPNIRLGGFD